MHRRVRTDLPPAPPNHRRKNFAALGGQRPPLGSPYGRAGERSASLRGRVLPAGYDEPATLAVDPHRWGSPGSMAGGSRAGRAKPAPWLSLWESWRANSEPERAQAVANMRKVPRLLHGTLSVTATPCQLSHRESQGVAAPPGSPALPSAPPIPPEKQTPGHTASQVVSRFCVAFCQRLWYAYKRYYQYPGRRFP